MSGRRPRDERDKKRKAQKDHARWGGRESVLNVL